MAQAHLNVMQQRDEFVTEHLISFQKMDTLVYDLIVHETWRRKIFPIMLDLVKDEDATVPVYTVVRSYP